MFWWTTEHLLISQKLGEKMQGLHVRHQTSFRFSKLCASVNATWDAGNLLQAKMNECTYHALRFHLPLAANYKTDSRRSTPRRYQTFLSRHDVVHVTRCVSTVNWNGNCWQKGVLPITVWTYALVVITARPARTTTSPKNSQPGNIPLNF